MAKNDWVVANINNPDFTVTDFRNIADLSTENTQLLSVDEYLKSDFIKSNPLFKDENGQFSQQKFRDFHSQVSGTFGELQNEEFSEGPALDMFDIDRTPSSRVQDIHFSISRGFNPDRQAIGIEGVNVWSDPEFSKREIAKQNLVFDYNKGEFRDYTVNDHTLVKGIKDWVTTVFGEPLVMATWDEDGEHVDPFSGQLVSHAKGEYKLNDKGTYYYETLGRRSVLNKDVLSAFDTLTVDGQGINKYDFFDSNDIKKSVGGTIMKNIVAVAPMFCGPVVGAIYGGTMVFRELSKSLPMIYGMATALLDDSETPNWMNNIAAKAQQATSSTSDYAQQHTFSGENFINLIGDVALQWQQQMFIARAFSKFKSPQKYIDEAKAQARTLYNAKRATLGDSPELLQACMNRYLPRAEDLATKSGAIGRNLSLGYMAIVSNTDVYGDMLDAGATKAEAAAVALGSTIGMYFVDKSLGLGEIFFDEATPNSVKMARKALKNEFKEAGEVFKNIIKSNEEPKKKIANLITKGAQASKKVFGKFWEDMKYHSLSGLGKAIGEGLEEVSEELIADMSKGLYELAGSLGFKTSVRDVGAWENAAERYTMSFLGGAIGGGVFYVKEGFQNGFKRASKTDEDMASLIRNGHADALRAQARAMYQEGKTGNKTLSASEYETDEKGNRTAWRTTDNVEQSQAKTVLNLVLDKINAVETVLTNSRVSLSDDQLFDNMVLTEQRYNKYKEIAPITNYYQDYATRLQDVIQAELDVIAAEKTIDGTVNGQIIPTDSYKWTDEARQRRAENIQNLKQKAIDAKAAVQDFLSGNVSLDYTRKLNFAMDPNLHANFLNATFEEWLAANKPGVEPDPVNNPTEYLQLYAEWTDYVKTQLKTRLDEAWQKYKDVGKIVDPHLHKLKENQKAYKAWSENIENLFTSGALNMRNLTDVLIDENTKLDGETDEEFNMRATRKVDPDTGELEDLDVFRARQLDRKKKVEDYNNQKKQEYVDKIETELQKVGYKVDPLTAQIIKRSLPGTLASVLKDNFSEFTSLKGGAKLAEDASFKVEPFSVNIATILQNLKLDGSNLVEIQNKIKDAYISAYGLSIRNSLNEVFGDFGRLKEELEDLDMTEGITIETLGELKAHLQELLDAETEAKKVAEAVAESEEGTSATEEEATPIEGDSYFDTIDKKAAIEAITFLEQVTKNAAAVDGYQIQTDIASVSDIMKMVTPLLAEEVETALSPHFNTMDSRLQDYFNDPVVKLQRKLQTSIVNPVAEFIAAVAASNGDVLPNIEQILQTIQDEYDNLDDIGQLFVDDGKRAEMEKARDYLRLVQAYLYAAYSTPAETSIIGHNRVINKFARDHASKLRTPWEELPTLDPDYGVMFDSIIKQYERQIDNWIYLSDQMQMNKAQKALDTDKAFSQSMFKILSSIPRAFTVNGHSHDLLEGFENIDQSVLKTDDAQVALYQLERLIYANVVKAAEAEGLTVADLVAHHQLLEFMLQNDLKALSNRMPTELTPTMTEANITLLTQVQYLATVMTEDPAVFYGMIQQRIGVKPEVAPMLTQELSARIGQASMNDSYRQIMSYAYSKADDPGVEFADHTTVIFGVAGAGKTQVVLNTIDAVIKDKEVLVVGPTLSQANNLKKALGRESAMDFEAFFTTLLGIDVWNQIKQEIESCKTYPYSDGTWFSTELNSNGMARIRLKAIPSFKTLPKIPAAIYVDEATHLSTVQALILNEYAKSVGAQLFLCGDPLQAGYSNTDSLIQNIDEGALWASAQPPKLMQSIRYENLQKFLNQERVKAVLNQVQHARLHATFEEYMSMADAVRNQVFRLNFHAYQGETINGDLLTDTLKPEAIEALKKAQQEGKTIGFIGSDSSGVKAQLEAAGIVLNDPTKGTSLTVSQMQGREFDYTVIDVAPGDVDTMADLRNFLQKLYTLMSRSRHGSLFVGNGWSSTIGSNVMAKTRSQAPGFHTVGLYRGKKMSGVEYLRQFKTEVLQKFDLTPIDTTPGSPTAATNPDLDFIDPDKRGVDEPEARKAVEETSKDDSDESDSEFSEIVEGAKDVGSFQVQVYSEVAYLGIEEGDPNEEHTTKDGRTVTAATWTIPPATVEGGEKVLRNLQAIIGEGKQVWRYMDKYNWEHNLSQVRSLAVSGGDWDTLPLIIKSNFNQDDWNKGTYELEFRKVSPTDRLPWRSTSNGLKEGFEYMNTAGEVTQDLIAEIVFKVKNNKGQWCKIDLGGINNPKTLLDKSPEIKDALQAKVNSVKTSEDEKQRLRDLLSTWDSDSQAYRNWFETQLAEFNKKATVGSVYSIDVSKAIVHKTMTRFRKRSVPMRLGGTLNLDNIDETNVQSLMWMHPDLVFSSVYTFTGKEKEFNKIDPSVAGKAVVFVSGNTLLDPADLPKLYIEQKNNPSTHTPEVRMIVLQNYGITFSQFTDSDFVSKTAGGVNDVLPLRKNFMGIRMFTSIWNHRASLMQFRNALNTWQTQTGYTNAQIDTLIRAHSAKNFLGKSDAEVEALLKASGLELKDIDELNRFNNEVCKDIPTYRLGHTENSNGFHVQSFDIKNSTAYKDSTVNLLVIDPDTADKFFKMVDLVLNYICPTSFKSSVVRGSTLNLQFEKVEVDTKGKETRKQWPPEELIDLKQAKHKRSLSGLFLKQQGSQEITIIDPTTGSALAYPTGSYWSMIPAMIQRIYTTVVAAQYDPTLVGNGESVVTRFTAKSATKTESSSLTIDLTSFFGTDGAIKPTGTDGTIDPIFGNMFNLIFHGTVEDVHGYITEVKDGKPIKRKRTAADKPLMQLSDAYFIHGFSIHPDAAYYEDGSSLVLVEKVTGKKQAVFYKIDTDVQWFTSDVDPYSSSIQLNLRALLGLDSKPEPKGPPVAPVVEEENTGGEEAPEVNTDQADMIAALQVAGHTPPKSRAAIQNQFNRLQVKTVLGDQEYESISTIKDTRIGYYQGKFRTVKEWLTDVKGLKIDSEGRIVQEGTGQFYKLSRNVRDGKLELTPMEAPVTAGAVGTKWDAKIGTSKKTVKEQVLNVLDNGGFLKTLAQVQLDLMILKAPSTEQDLNPLITELKEILNSGDAEQMQAKFEKIKNPPAGTAEQSLQIILTRSIDGLEDYLNKC